MGRAFSIPVQSVKGFLGKSVVATAPTPAWAVRKRLRSQPHGRRKLYHMLAGLMCSALYAFVLTKTEALWVLGAIGGSLVVFDVARLLSPRLNRVGVRFFSAFMRREELNRLTANSFYILGMFLVTVCFDKPVALLSILFLAFGDPAAATFGSLWGKTKLWKNKSLEGALANFVVCGVASFLVGVLYLSWNVDSALLLALVGGGISTLSELCPAPVDDNFTIPVFSAVLLSISLPLF